MNFSIIVATYNRSKFIESFLQQISRIKYTHGSWETIVVDNNSKDHTSHVINNFIKKNPNIQIKYVFESVQGRTRAFEKGLGVIQYSHVVSLDDDIEFNSDILEKYYLAYKRWPNAAIIGGKIDVLLLNNKSSKFNSPYFVPPFRWLLGGLDLGNNPIQIKNEEVYCANMSFNLAYVRRPVYHPWLGKVIHNVYFCGDDAQLCRKTILQRKSVYYDPNICVTNKIDKNRLSFSYFLKRYLSEGVSRKIIDNSLAKYRNHIKYRLIHSFKLIINSVRSYNVLIVILISFAEAVYWFGYNILSIYYVKESESPYYPGFFRAWRRHPHPPGRVE